MLKVKSFLKEVLILIAIFVLLFLENTLPLLKGMGFLKNLPFLTIFLFIFFLKSPVVFFLAFFSGAFLDFYSPLPLFSFAFLFLALAFITKYLQKMFYDTSPASFLIAFFFGFVAFRLLIFFSFSSLKFYFNFFPKDLLSSLIISLIAFFTIKLTKKNAS